MNELPFRGQRPMKVGIEGVGVFESLPMVVHSWCVSCLFQISVLDDDWKERLLTSMFLCPTLQFGTFDQPVSRGGVSCQFCGKDNGWLTFCMYHNIHRAGCDRCRDSTDRSRTYHAFHPSCAVRHGMQRMVRKGKRGMFCARHKDWRARGLKSMKPWLGFLSGFNYDIVNLDCMVPSNFAIDTSVPSKGESYGNSMIPSSQRN